MSKEEFLNYIIDFAMDTEWMQIQRNVHWKAIFTVLMMKHF